MGQKVWELSIDSLSAKIRRKEVSPVEVAEAHLHRIDQLNGKLNAFITVFWDQSLVDAKKAEALLLSGTYLGPLHGVPVGLKDLYYVKGALTTAGSKVLSDFKPAYDAAVTERLKGAGAVIMGKLNMDEFARGGTTENPHFGTCHNPWDTERIAGGSSGGSAASVCAGLCMASMGSDTRGSVRGASALYGVVGLQPTYGRVSCYGVVPTRWTLDHMGPIARNVRDVALIMNAISGYDTRDPASSQQPVPDFTESLDAPVKGLKIGLIRDYLADVVDPEVDKAFKDALGVLEGLGVSICEISLPSLKYSTIISDIISYAEASAYHEPFIKQRPEGYGPRVRSRTEVGFAVHAVDYIKAQRARALFVQEVLEVFKKVDILASPTSAIPAPRIGEEAIQVKGVNERMQTPLGTLMGKFLRWTNLVGVPALSVPCGFSSHDLPIGLHLAGRPFNEASILNAANVYEASTPWHLKRPLFSAVSTLYS